MESCIPELQTFLFLRYYNTAIRLIALMCNTIMQSLQDDHFIIFPYFCWNQCVVRILNL